MFRIYIFDLFFLNLIFTYYFSLRLEKFIVLCSCVFCRLMLVAQLFWTYEKHDLLFPLARGCEEFGAGSWVCDTLMITTLQQGWLLRYVVECRCNGILNCILFNRCNGICGMYSYSGYELLYLYQHSMGRWRVGGSDFRDVDMSNLIMFDFHLSIKSNKSFRRINF